MDKDPNELILTAMDELRLEMLELSGRGEEPCSLAKTPGDNNWIEDVHGSLPNYICNVAKEIKKSGKTTSTAIAMAISQIKKWIANPKTTAETKAKATKAIAEWEALKAKSHAKSTVKASAQVDDAVELSAKHDLIFYENRNTPEVVPQGSKPKKSGGKAGKIVKRRAATAAEEKQIASGKWVRVDKGGNKPGDSSYHGGSKIRPQLKASATAMDEVVALSKTFASSDFHDAHKGQKCSRWQHDSPVKAVKCREVRGRHLGACAAHAKEMTK